MRALRRWWIVSAALVCSGAVAQRDRVAIISPKPGELVRGVIEIVAEKPNPNEGAYAWKIAPAGREAEADFQANTVAGTPFTLDTAVRNEKGDRVYPDGVYVIVANGFDAAGQLQRTVPEPWS